MIICTKVAYVASTGETLLPLLGGRVERSEEGRAEGRVQGRAEGRAEGHEQGIERAIDAILAGRGFTWTQTVREARRRSRATDADVIAALLHCEDEADFRARLHLPPR